MIKRTTFLLSGLALLFSCQRIQIDNPEITSVELNEHIAYLASDSLRGRRSGTPEGKLAAEYIRDQFRMFGYDMLEDNGFQYFEVITEVEAGPSNAISVDDMEASVMKDFTPLSYSSNGSLEANVVFCGYGFDIEETGLKWNDFEGVDVGDQWVLVLRADPEPDNNESRFLPYTQDRSKVITAKDKGAAGVLLVSGEELDASDKITEPEVDRLGTSSGIPVFHISRTLANKILEKSENTLAGLEKILNDTHAPSSFDCETTVSGTSEINFVRVNTQNVLGFMEGSDPILKNDVVVVGGHYDHLGMGGANSGSRAPGEEAVHNGADDNASGTATVIEIAEKLAANRSELKRSVLVMAFGAEEMGLLGSKYFTQNPSINLDRIVAMVNVDMVGRLNEKGELAVGGTGTSTESETLLNRLVENYALKLAMSPNGFGPSDHSSFYVEDIPVFFFSTGAHEDYHTPNDVIDYVHFDGLKKLSDFVYDLSFELAGMDSNLVFREAGPRQQTTGRRRSGVRLGIMPSFTQTGISGLGVDGVTPGGPGSLAGIQKGDVITAIDGKSVSDIYEYMARMSKLKFGQTVSIDILREGEKKILLVHLEDF